LKGYTVTASRIPKKATCSFCDGPVDGWGNNPAPLIGKRCCDDCNLALVIPVRQHLLRYQLQKSAHSAATPAAHSGHIATAHSKGER
jgi:hypothetical protein